MVYLPDVNVLIALAWPTHLHHEKAHEWFSSQGRDGWATCPLTQCGFVRVSSNARIFVDAVSPLGAVEALGRMTRHPAHEFWPDEISLPDLVSDNGLLLAGHSQVTDACLLGLAARHDGMLVTFDTGIAGLANSESGLHHHLQVLKP